MMYNQGSAFLLLCFLLLLLQDTESFRTLQPTAIRRLQSSTTKSTMMVRFATNSQPPMKSENQKPSWQIEEDSSEIQCGSSSDPVPTPSSSTKDPPKTSLQVTPNNKPTSSNQGYLTANQNTAFDAGLLVMFPIIILTLGIFLVFPLLAPQFASTLPQPMSY